MSINPTREPLPGLSHEFEADILSYITSNTPYDTEGHVFILPNSADESGVTSAAQLIKNEFTTNPKLSLSTLSMDQAFNGASELIANNPDSNSSRFYKLVRMNFLLSARDELLRKSGFTTFDQFLDGNSLQEKYGFLDSPLKVIKKLDVMPKYKYGISELDVIYSQVSLLSQGLKPVVMIPISEVPQEVNASDLESIVRIGMFEHYNFTNGMEGDLQVIPYLVLNDQMSRQILSNTSNWRIDRQPLITMAGVWE